MSLLLLSAPAAAQEEGGRTIRIGAGAQVVPKYPCADDFRIAPTGVFSVRRAGDPIPFGSPDESFGISLLRSGPISFGPVINFRGKRDEEDVGAPVGDVGFTVEAGAFVQYALSPSLRLHAEGRRGIGGHDGFVGELAADFIVRDGDHYILSIGPRARFSDDDYQDAYFGVSPAAAAASNLTAYDPDGGLHAVGAVAGVTYQFNRTWGIYGYAGYDRLVGDAADSPIVRVTGSRDQFSGGLALTYTFDIGR